jgi:hypothetical protein
MSQVPPVGPEKGQLGSGVLALFAPQCHAVSCFGEPTIEAVHPGQGPPPTPQEVPEGG